ncbi:MAG TPA: endolytic transglycosylase MltG [Candidatus Paceibacterota bacterium]
MKLKHLVLILIMLVTSLGALVWRLGFSASDLANLSFYMDLANPSVKVVQVYAGMRKEEIADRVGDKLGWNEADKENFLNAHLALNTEDLEGKYFPKTYLINEGDNPADVTAVMLSEFEKQTDKIKKVNGRVVNEDTVIKIASIIQREAAGKQDMRLISGIIWNRIWAGMKLQMDATLQYAKGTEEEGWWPRVYSEDKRIDSEYNTYMYKGLPPGPIANPGLEALKAAYNPAETKCMFYIHDKKHRIHCAETYEKHKENIEKYL